MTTISYDYFSQLDIRLGLIINAENIDGADKLLKLSVDLGSETRQIVAGIAQLVSDPSELIGKHVPILCNLEPRTLRGVESQGMMLAVGTGTDVVLLTTEKPVAVGSQVT